MILGRLQPLRLCLAPSFRVSRGFFAVASKYAGDLNQVIDITLCVCAPSVSKINLSDGFCKSCAVNYDLTY